MKMMYKYKDNMKCEALTKLDKKIETAMIYNGFIKEKSDKFDGVYVSIQNRQEDEDWLVAVYLKLILEAKWFTHSVEQFYVCHDANNLEYEDLMDSVKEEL